MTPTEIELADRWLKLYEKKEVLYGKSNVTAPQCPM